MPGDRDALRFAPAEALAKLTMFMPFRAIAASLRATNSENGHLVGITTQPDWAESATGAANELPGKLAPAAAATRKLRRVVLFMSSLPVVRFDYNALMGLAAIVGQSPFCEWVASICDEVSSRRWATVGKRIPELRRP